MLFTDLTENNAINKIVTLFILASSLFYSCEKETLFEEDHFFVSNNDAHMAVYIRGNLDSDAIILFLHGGPGGNASQAINIPPFQEIEGEFAIAYCDQRGSGLTQGNPDKATFTMEQFVEDTHYVVEALKSRYPGKKLFLLGHSWGRALASAYLATTK